MIQVFVTARGEAGDEITLPGVPRIGEKVWYSPHSGRSIQMLVDEVIWSHGDVQVYGVKVKELGGW